MADRRYSGGSRGNAQIRGTGKMSENRVAWVKANFGQLVILKYDDADPGGDTDQPGKTEPDSGPTIRLYVPRPNARDFSLNITALTEEELLAFEEFMAFLFELAKPVVRERDRIASEALADGDDSYTRVYRQAPQFVVRQGAKPADGEGVLRGPDDLPGGSGGGESATGDDGGLRGAGDGLAEPEPGSDLPQDDGPQAD